MAWSTNYITILQSHSKEWLTTKGQADTKEKLIKVVAKEITTYRTEHRPNEGALLNLQKSCLATPPDSQNTQADL